MARRLELWFSKLTVASLPLGVWAVALLGIVAVRTMFEATSSRPLVGNLIFDGATYLHYVLFYFTLLLALVLIVRFATRRPVQELTTLALYVLPVIWLAPLVDLATSGFIGAPMAYLYQTWPELGRSLVSYFGPLALPGVTFGIRIEVFVIIGAIGWYVFSERRSVVRAALAALGVYLTVFTWVAWPSVVAGVFTSTGLASVAGWWQGSLLSSHLAQRAFMDAVPTALRLDLLSNLALSQFYYLVAVGLAARWLLRHDRRQLVALLRNARVERVLHYLLLMALGWFVGVEVAGSDGFGSFVDALRLVVLAVALVCSWLQAVATNDVADVYIDAIANPGRPLIRGELTTKEMRRFGNVFLFWALLGGVLLGFYTLLAILVFLLAYGVYSMPPFRLKRVPILATFLISLACLTAAVAGFSIVYPANPLLAFPRALGLLVVLGFTLGVNVKDVKDIAGDARDGIATLLTVFGEKRGKKIVGVFVAVGMCLASVILKAPWLWLVSLPAALVAYAAINRQPYRERRVFIIYFAYLTASAVLWWLSR